MPHFVLNALARPNLGYVVVHLTLGGRVAASDGRIEIAWRIVGEPGNGTLEFEWSEHGGRGSPQEPARSGFGSEVLRRVLPYELDAEIDASLRADGLHYRVNVPVRRALASADEGT